MLARGESARAVALARRAHEHRANSTSEALLCEAYLARLEGLDAQMGPEADTLLRLAQTHCPNHRGHFTALRPRLLARQGRFDELLAPLRDPALGEAERRLIEAAVAQEAVDLRALAATTALPPDHPLRLAAGAIHRALAAVTQRPVADEVIALPEVSRRSPLAPWRLLVQAIAQFYRRDDAACAGCLDRIEPLSSAARLVPVLRALIGSPSNSDPPSSDPPSSDPPSSDPPSSDPPSSGAEVVNAPGDNRAARALARTIGAADTALREALHALDQALSRPERKLVLKTVSDTVRQCRRTHPALLDELRRRVSVRCWSAGLPADKVARALEGPAPRDAQFWRLLARASEQRDDRSLLRSCAIWEEFCRVAVLEGWFAGTGPEAACVHRHIADLLLAHPPKQLDAACRVFLQSFKGWHSWYEGQPEPYARLAPATPPGTVDLAFADPEAQLRLTCEGDPRADSFARWLDWAERQRDGKAGRRAAEAWHLARPTDSRPLLYMLRAAERRGALTEAKRHLARAEQLDGHKLEIQRARLRLTVALALRHLKQRQLHLAKRDLAALGALPRIEADDGLALLAVLHALLGALEGDAPGAASLRGEAASQIGEAGATVLGLALMGACGTIRGAPFKAKRRAPTEPAARPGALASSVARGIKLGLRLERDVAVPASWEPALKADLFTSEGQPTLELAELQALAEGALRSAQPRLAYTASAAGLARTGSDPLAARFLLLRARSLSGFSDPERTRRCFAAAVALGHAAEDLVLVGEAIDLAEELALERDPWEEPFAAVSLRLSREEAQEVLAAERQASRSLDAPASRPPRGAGGSCPCAICRAERGERVRAHEVQAALDALDEDSDDDEEDGFGFDPSEFPPDMPLELIPLTLEIVSKHGPNALDPEVLGRVDPELFVRFVGALNALEQRGVRFPGRTRRSRRGGAAKKRSPRRGR